jgi:Eukaryotic protein of unknown function (DUF866)
MVLFFLLVKADVENVSALKLKIDQNLCLTVRNPLSDYEIREKVVVNPCEFVEQDDNAREPPHHFSLCWDGSKKQSTMTILNEAEVKSALKKDGKKGKSGKNGSDDKTPRDYTSEDSGNYVPILCVDCRGLEPTEFFPMGNEFIVISQHGAVFDDDIDLSDGDWGDYDADNDMPVSLSNIEFKWGT